ncbi:MAG: glycosyltransferase family 4 protein [Ardenticatenaceae bacterium]|nr:glycosyltransferase family 4 protein [Anaerolineales bacterium]MCB8922181.1 glycosyltransferase family 4 protein [Ardenticatenaceae bacterium]
MQQTTADKPRLTYAIQHFDKTGEMRAPYLICKAFVELGWAVDIQTMGTAANAGVELAWGQVPLRKIAGLNKKATLLKLAASLLHKRRQHVVLSFVWDWHCYGLLLAKWLFGSPYALALDTYVHRSGATWRTRLWEAVRYGPLLRNADLILAECPDAFAAAKRYTRRPEVRQVPFCLWQRDLEAIEARWQTEGFAPQREPVILYAGRLVERKRVHDLIAAFSRLAAQFPKWTLEIRGLPDSPEYGQLIAELVSSSGLDEQVRFLPGLSREALYRRYREVSIFALTSEGEGMPTTITEAMFFGGAIVAGISGALAYQLEDGRCGCLHEPGDLEMLTHHLQTLMASQQVREGYMMRARARMLSLLVWERYFPELEARFRRLVVD